MSAKVLDLDNIIQFRSVNFKKRVRKLNCILHQDLFGPIWEGGIRPHGTPFFLRRHISIDAKGRLRYYNKLYNRRIWSWQPPKVIRLQGRIAEEYPNPSNNAPIDWFKLGDTWVKVRRSCDECDGDLIYEPDGLLYCNECGLQAA